MKRCYFDVNIKGSFKENHILVSKIIKILHCTINGNDDNTLSVGFPFYESHNVESFATVGKTLRFVGDRADVLMFSRNHSLNILAELGAMEISKIDDVPDFATEVIYKRNRAIEKHYKNKELHKIKKHYPKFKVLNNSGQGYTFFIEMKKSDVRVDNGFTSYGLSTEGSTFPLF